MALSRPSPSTVFVLLNNICLISIHFPFSHVNLTMQGWYVMGETLTILTLRRVTIRQSVLQSEITRPPSWPISGRKTVKVDIPTRVVWLFHPIIKTYRHNISQYRGNSTHLIYIKQQSRPRYFRCLAPDSDPPPSSFHLVSDDLVFWI